MHARLALGMAVCMVGCNAADAPKAALAAATLGVAVAAAAIDRAANGDCWGSCRPGTFCDSSSGMCLPLPEVQGTAPATEPEADWIACDRARYQCEADLWLRCQLPCEWVMCESQGVEREPPRRCCEQRCEWLVCPDDGRPCRQLGREPLKRTALALESSDPCRGLCLAGESCLVRDGVADCVPAPP
jgi:hypothetical protein